MKRDIPTELVLLLALVLVHSAVGQTLTGPNDCTAAGAYTLCQNLWGAASGVGSETTTLRSASGNSVSWETTYTWANSPDNVKAYPNVGHNTAKGMQLQDIVSAPTTWQWNYQSASGDLRADVSYDIWTGVPQFGAEASSASSYEIMIWLSNRGGIGGIGNTVAQNLQLGGHTWTLKHGPNSNWDVFSFITAEGDINNFNADLNDFFQYLINEQGVAKTQYLQVLQSGTEPFTGSADLVITNYSVDVSTQAATSPSSSSSVAPSSTFSPAPSSTPPASSTHSSSSSSSNEASSTGSSSSAAGSAAASTSTDSSAPAQETGPVGVRAAGGRQCRLQLPGEQERLRRRTWIGSWFRR